MAITTNQKHQVPYINSNTNLVSNECACLLCRYISVHGAFIKSLIQSCRVHSRVVMYTLLVVAVLSIGAVESSDGDCGAVVVPAGICGSAGLLCPPCTSQQFTCQPVSGGNSSESGEDEEWSLDLLQLARSCNDKPSVNASLYAVVMSDQLVDVLAEQVLQSITTVAGAIVALAEQLSWSRFAMLADVSDAYFLRTAETVYSKAPSSSDITFLQLGGGNAELEATLSRIERQNLRIVVVSLRASLARQLLCEAYARGWVWPDYAWVVHSVDVETKSCESFMLEGVIDIQYMQPTSCNNSASLAKGVQGLVVCQVYDQDFPQLTGVYQWRESSQVLAFQYLLLNNNLSLIDFDGPVPSDLLPLYSPLVFLSLYYVGISACFVVVTVTMVLYFYYRKQPEIKATSVSLSVFMFLGCYLLIFYLLVLNSTLLPSYHKQSNRVRNFICVFRVWIHGLGFPIALILSTLLVKLLRVYRIFNCYGKINKLTSGNFALAVYVLLLASPNFLICLIWSTSDHYISHVSFSVEDGSLLVTEQCVSRYTIEWLTGLIVYLVVICLLLVFVAVLTRKVKHKNFKDSKKVSALSFIIVLTLSVILSYWYLLRILEAHVVLVHAMLQVGHYYIILECVGFIFVPKLFPIVVKQLRSCQK